MRRPYSLIDQPHVRASPYRPSSPVPPPARYLHRAALGSQSTGLVAVCFAQRAGGRLGLSGQAHAAAVLACPISGGWVLFHHRGIANPLPVRLSQRQRAGECSKHRLFSAIPLGLLGCQHLSCLQADAVLYPVHSRIDTAQRHQLLMGTGLSDPPVFNYQDKIRIAYGRKTVGDG